MKWIYEGGRYRVRLILRALRTGVRRVYGLLDPLLKVGGVRGGGPRGYV